MKVTPDEMHAKIEEYHELVGRIKLMGHQLWNLVEPTDAEAEAATNAYEEDLPNMGEDIATAYGDKAIEIFNERENKKFFGAEQK